MAKSRGGDRGGRATTSVGLTQEEVLAGINFSAFTPAKRKIIVDALGELPPEHYDGIYSFNDKLNSVTSRAEFDALNHRINVSPTYMIATVMSVLSNRLISNSENAGLETFGMRFTRTIAHEVGHHIYFNRLTDAQHTAWVSHTGYMRATKTIRISEYAKTNVHEYFAEAYSHYMRGGTARDNLRLLEPKTFKLMEVIVNSIKGRATLRNRAEVILIAKRGFALE